MGSESTEIEQVSVVLPNGGVVVIENGDGEVLIRMDHGELFSALAIEARERGVSVSSMLGAVIGYGLAVLGYDVFAIIDTLPMTG